MSNRKSRVIQVLQFTSQSEFSAVLSVGLQLLGVPLRVLLDLQPSLPVVLSFVRGPSLLRGAMPHGHVCKKHKLKSQYNHRSCMSFRFFLTGAAWRTMKTKHNDYKSLRDASPYFLCEKIRCHVYLPPRFCYYKNKISFLQSVCCR